MPRRRSPDQIDLDLKSLAKTREGDSESLELLQEVQIYQEELTVQNEELRRAQQALEEARDLYIELYEFAPNGYLTLNRNGMVKQLNLTAAALLGRPRDAIEGLPLLGFIIRQDRPAFLAFLRRCRRQVLGESSDLKLQLASPDGQPFVQLLCRSRRDKGGNLELLTTLINVTAERTLQGQRDELARARVSLAQKLITAQEDERLRIARDLHDNAGQQMTALRLKVAALASRAVGGHLHADIDDLQESLEALDRQLDFIATELRPTVLDAGLAVALKDFVQQWSSTYRMPAEFHAVGMTVHRLAPEVETHLYRVAQEALNNVFKHAAATRASVLLERRREEVVLVIEDDGRGFDPASRSSGFGLVGIRERAAIVGGSLQLESTPGRGTTVYFHVPVSAPGTSAPPPTFPEQGIDSLRPRL